MASKPLSPLILHLLLVGLLLIIQYPVKARGGSIEFAAYGEEKLSNVVVVGNVLCEACPGSSSHIIRGAAVGLECAIDMNRKISRRSWVLVEVGESDEYGDFMVDVPSAFHPEERMNKCNIRLVSSPEVSCNVPSTTQPSKLSLISNDLNGGRTYTTAYLSFRPRFCHNRDISS